MAAAVSRIHRRHERMKALTTGISAIPASLAVYSQLSPCCSTPVIIPLLRHKSVMDRHCQQRQPCGYVQRHRSRNAAVVDAHVSLELPVHKCLQHRVTED